MLIILTTSLAVSAVSQQLLDGFSFNFVQSYILLRGGIQMSLVTPPPIQFNCASAAERSPGHPNTQKAHKDFKYM